MWINEFRIPLLNAHHGDGVLDFGFGFHVRDVTDQEVQRWASDPFVRDVVPHRVLPEIRSVLIHQGALSYSSGEHVAEFEKEIMRWIGLVSLVTERQIEIAFGEFWIVGENSEQSTNLSNRMIGPVRYFDTALPVSGAPPWNHSVSIEAAAAFFKIARPRFASSENLSRAMHFALSRWLLSIDKRRRTLEDAIVDLSIALESLFIRNDERSDIAKLLRERIARFWDASATPKAARIIKNHVNDFYGIRSAIVHGSIVETEKLETARGNLHQFVREVLLDYAFGLLDDFDPEKLWAKGHSESPDTDV